VAHNGNTMRRRGQGEADISTLLLSYA
jgi:hypothetical protein